METKHVKVAGATLSAFALMMFLGGCSINITVNNTNNDNADNQVQENRENTPTTSNGVNASTKDNTANTNVNNTANTNVNGTANTNVNNTANANADKADNSNVSTETPRNSNSASSDKAPIKTDSNGAIDRLMLKDFLEAGAPVDATSQYGKNSTGYIKVASDWKDMTSTLDERIVDSTDAVYIADPTTEYTSAQQSHFAFSTSIKMEVFPVGFADRGTELQNTYSSDAEGYTKPTWSAVKLDGHNAAMITTHSLIDNTDIVHLVVDRDDTGSTCVVITATMMPSTAEKVMGYVSGWTSKKQA